MALAGTHHMTISPPLLKELSSKVPSSTETVESEFSKPNNKPPGLMTFADDEPAFRMALTRNKANEPERKMIQVRATKSSDYRG